MKNKRFLVVVFVLSLALSACSSKSKKTNFFGEDEKRSRPKVQTVTKLDRNWVVGIGDKLSSRDAILSPAVLGDSVYAASTNGKVTKVSLSTGKRIWKKSFKKQYISAGVGVGGGLVLVATDQGDVYALKQEDGSVAWQATLASSVLATPVIDGNLVIARTGDGKVYGLSSFDGSVEWTISRNPPSLTLNGESKPLVAQGVVFVGFPDGTLAALEASTGRALWDFPISFRRGTNELEGLSDIDTTPLLVGSSIYISSYQDVTHSIDITKQDIAWTADVSSYHSLAYDAAFLYVSDRQGIVHQIDRQTGETVWSQEGLKLYSISAPISVGPYVLVADGEGDLYVINKNDGSFAGRHKLGAKTIVGDPVVDSDSVVFIDSNGRLQSLNILTR